MDFTYYEIAKDMWHEVIHAGKDLFKIHFDLENDSDITSPFTIKNDGAKFICQAYVAGGDWENPVLYYRCQLVDSEAGYNVTSFGAEISKYRDSFFIFIPSKADGNNNLIPNKKGGYAACHTDQGDNEDIDERDGRKALKGFLNDIVKKVQVPVLPETSGEQEEITEELNQDVRMVCARFDNYCTEHQHELNIVKDEPNIQAFVLPVKGIQDELNNYMQEVLDEYNVQMEIDENRRDGTLITISKQTINDGHWRAITDKDKEDKDHIAMSPLQDKDAKKVRKGKTIYQQGKKYRLDEIWRWPTRTLDRVNGSAYYSVSSQYFSKPNTCDPKQSKKTKAKGIHDADEPIEEMEYKPLVGKGKIAVEEPDTNNLSATRTNEYETGEDNDFYGGKKHSKPRGNRKDLTDLDPTDQDNPFEPSFLDDEQDDPFSSTLKDFSKQYDFTPLGNRLSLGRPGEANRPMSTDNVPASSYQPDDPIVEPNRFTTVIPADSATKDAELDNTIADTAAQLFGGLSGMTGVRPQKVPLDKGDATVSNVTSRRSGFEQPDVYKKDHSFPDDTEDVDDGDVDEEENILKGILDTDEEEEEEIKFRNINRR